MIKGKKKYATGGEIKPVEDITQLYPDILNFVLQQTQQRPDYDQLKPRVPRLARPGFDFQSTRQPQISEKQNSIQRVESLPRTESEEKEDEDVPEVSQQEAEVDESFLANFGATRRMRKFNPDGSTNVNMIKGNIPGINAAAQGLKDYFDSKGIPSHISAGIVGNLHAESNLNTGAVNRKSNAFGMAQWLGTRKKDLQSFAKKDGRSITDPTLQADFIIHELNTSEKAAYNELLKTHTPQEAAAVFGKAYERPSDEELKGSLSRRIRVANTVHQNNDDMKKSKKAKYATGGSVGIGNMPWDTIINGGIQIVDTLLNNPAENYTDQPLMNIKQTSMTANPYGRGFKFATGGAVVKEYGFGETPEGLTQAQLAALNAPVDNPWAGQIQTAAEQLKTFSNPLTDPYYAANPDGTFAINTTRINADRTAASGRVGDTYSVHTNRPIGYEGLYGTNIAANPGWESSYQSDFMFATGGVVPMQGVEVEGDEVAETPQGQLMEFDGPSHEEGGIDINLPTGTKIYSDRLKLDGKTMQERKKDRERTLARMKKMLDKNPSDPFAKNAVGRVNQVNEIQDNRDMQLQEAARQIYPQPVEENSDQFATGGKIHIKPENRGKFNATKARTGKTTEELTHSSNPVTRKRAIFAQNAAKWKHAMGGNVYATGGQVVYNPQTGMFEDVTNGQSDITVPYAAGYIAPLDTQINTQIDITKPIGQPLARPASLQQPSSSIPSAQEDSYSADTNTIGNVIGMAGSAFGAVAPLINTMNNASATKPNKNFYQNFGKNALDTNQAAQSYIAGQQANAMTDLRTQSNASRMAARNSARGINTIRALDIANQLATSKGSNELYNTYVQQMMSLLGQRAGLQNQQDQFVMSGAHQADIANRQDVDNYYSNLGRDLQSLAGGIQNAGRQLNQIQQNNDALDFINDQGEHVQYKRNRRTGRWELVPISN